VDSVPGAQVTGISMGLIVPAEPPVRVEWGGVRFSGPLVLARSLSILWVAAVFGLSVALFDRFQRGRLPLGTKGRRFRKASGETSPEFVPSAHPVLSPVVTTPAFARSVRAEVILLWKEAGALRWPLLASAVLAAVPWKAPNLGVAAFLLFLAPALSEAAARERIAGTSSLVLSQPGVPSRALAWKVVSAIAFVLMLGAPSLASIAMLSPSRLPAFLCGLCFVAVFASAAGSLTGGGKLFLGAYLAIWYAAVSGGGALDYSGALGATPGGSPFGFLAFGIALLGVAMVVERARAAA
jgi:hypothetical protein